MNEYRPVALKSVIMKCFERLVMAYIRDTINITVDHHQYSYMNKRCTSDVVAVVVHQALTNLEGRDAYSTETV